MDVDTFLATLVLTRGKHNEDSGEFCAMEAVARLNGEPHSDEPVGACPVITRYVQRINDARWSSNTARTGALRPWLERIGSSRCNHATKVARARWLANRTLTWWAPLAGMAAVQCLETYRYKLRQQRMREAYLALLNDPCHKTALEAHNATTEAYAIAYVFADIHTLDTVDATIAAIMEADYAIDMAYANTDYDYGDTDTIETVEAAAASAVAAANSAAFAATFAAAYPTPDAPIESIQHRKDNARDFYLRAAVEDLEELLSIHGVK